MKRVLSYYNNWFSEDILPHHERLLKELTRHDGWLPLKSIAGFPELVGWVKAPTVEKAFEQISGQTGRHEMCTIVGDHMVRPKRFGRRLEQIRAAAAASGEPEPACLVRAAAQSYAPTPDIAETRTFRRLQATANKQELHAQRRRLKPFRFTGEVRVVSSMSGGRDLRRLTDLLQRDGQGSTGRLVVGFDVEYASLEEDLHMQPALIAMGCAELVGLIWLDKLPDHGRRVLTESAAWHSLGSSVYKVGVGSHEDMKRLLDGVLGLLCRQTA